MQVRVAVLTSMCSRPIESTSNSSNALPDDLPLASVKELIGTGEIPLSNWLLVSTGIEPYG